MTANSGTTNDLFGVSIGFGFAAAVGSGGTIVRSTEDIAFTTFARVDSGTTNDLFGIEQSSNQFAAVGGVRQITVDIPEPSTFPLLAIASIGLASYCWWRMQMKPS